MSSTDHILGRPTIAFLDRAAVNNLVGQFTNIDPATREVQILVVSIFNVLPTRSRLLQMVDTAAANATLKRKASRSPPPEDGTLKRVKPAITGDEVSTANGDANGNTKSTSNDAVDEKPETVDTSPPSPKRAKRDAESPVDLREPSADVKPADSNANGKSPEQARRPSTSSGPSAARKEIAQDEKKRAKRLFGGLLSTLSQTSSNSQQKKKNDVDRRQQEKAQQQRADDERRRAKKLEDRKAIRKHQQENLEEELVRVFCRFLLLIHLADWYLCNRWKPDTQTCSQTHAVYGPEPSQDW